MRHLSLLIICFFSFVVKAEVPPAVSSPLTEGAKQVFLVDFDTGRVLLEKNADEKVYPSSMTKIITVMLAFDRLKKNKLALTDQLPVSVRAWQQEGSRMFLNPNTHVTVDDILKGIIVQSGNDATTVLAEGLGGSEAQFAQEMTAFAKSLGATNTNFVNASGLPDPNHYSTVRDLGLLSTALIRQHPDFYPLFALQEFTYNGIKQGNRNPLLYKKGIPVDGIKTGMTDGGGYGMVASGELNGTRLILVVNGIKSMDERSKISEQLLTWGMQTFKKHKLFSQNQIIGTADIWLGAEPSVELMVPQDVILLLSHAEFNQLRIKAEYGNPVSAPVDQGQVLGRLIIEVPGQKEPTTFP